MTLFLMKMRKRVAFKEENIYNFKCFRNLMSNGKISDGTHNSAVDEEVDAGVEEEQKVRDGLGVEQVGGGEVVLGSRIFFFNTRNFNQEIQ